MGKKNEWFELKISKTFSSERLDDKKHTKQLKGQQFFKGAIKRLQFSIKSLKYLVWKIIMMKISWGHSWSYDYHIWRYHFQSLFLISWEEEYIWTQTSFVSKIPKCVSPFFPQATFHRYSSPVQPQLFNMQISYLNCCLIIFLRRVLYIRCKTMIAKSNWIFPY